MNLFIAGNDFACVFILFMIAISVLKLNKHEKKYIHYMICVVSLICVCISDSIAFAMDEVGGNILLHFYSNLISFVGIDIVLAAFVYYIFEKLNETIHFSKIHARIPLVICGLDMWLMIWGSFSGKLFRIEGQKIIYGPLFDYVGVSQLLVSGYFLIVILLKRKEMDRKLARVLSGYFLVPVLAIIMEIINKEFEFACLVTTVLFLVVYIEVVQEDLQESYVSERLLRKASLTDNLTGLYNRRAYMEDTARFSSKYPSDFVYLALDVNGLKTVNDNIGHAAGDEIIAGAAECIKKVWGEYGNVYRIGGDEFTALVNIPRDQFDRVVDEFENVVASWHGTLVDTFTISLGFVRAEEVQGVSLHEVSVLADKRMYIAKAAFYKKKGVDRRKQFEAHAALCNLYSKILKINITEDSYLIINMDENEQTEAKGFSNTISGWLTGFGRSGQVHEDDLSEYLRLTDINYLREYFQKGKKTISVSYHRKYEDGYKQVVMEMIPTNEYRNDNQELFLYVKPIDK